ncbi:restriction endonuclease subunit S [Clostridium sp. ZBS13]|uniref:restriction endonuclease subunit S n=1 Tax=Clostridium sp. ZBS13 TaxID=2949971 RepID=UPI00207A14FE|nr:restriction endonuclease subunit S [Clostridium sp. ZBS13]
MKNMKLPEGWKIDKLENLVSFTRGAEPGSASYTDDDTYTRFLRVSDISGTSKEKVYTVANNLKLVDKGNLLITLDGTPGIISDQFEGAISSGIRKIDIINDELLKDYLKFYLRSDNVQRIIYKYATGATILHASKSIQYIDVSIPPLETQKRIVEVLEKAEKALEKRKEAISLLDELVKSQFIEMCASGASDYEDWEKVKIEDIAEQKKGSMRTGPFGSSLLHSEFVDEGVFVLGIDNAVENRFTWNKMRYITDKKYEQLKNYTVFSGDVIITIMGTVGRSAVIPENFPKAINTKHLACITLNKSIANPYFISYCIHEHPYVMQQLIKQLKGAIMDGLNLTIIKSIKIPLPPIDIQEKFVDFMKQVDKLKFEMHESLKELENNFNSLMQSAFKGELFK